MKRLLSLNLILVMLLGLFSATAHAAENPVVASEHSFEQYLIINGTEYNAASDEILSDGEHEWVLSGDDLILQDYNGGPIETNVELNLYQIIIIHINE